MPFIEHLMGVGFAPLQASTAAGGGVTGLVATGTTATDALQLSASFNAITTSAASTGVKLPATSGGWIAIRNDSGQTITIYPQTGATINAAAASITLATAKAMLLFQTSATTWASILTA
jgi:outer membrane lipoprotein SlyB